MSRKELLDVSLALSQMIPTQRMRIDVERLAELPDGTIEIDLLNASSKHLEKGPIELGVSNELSKWLKSRLEELKVPHSDVSEAKIRADFKTDRIPTNRCKLLSVDWVCECEVMAGKKSYRSGPFRKHQWYERGAA